MPERSTSSNLLNYTPYLCDAFNYSKTEVGEPIYMSIRQRSCNKTMYVL